MNPPMDKQPKSTPQAAQAGADSARPAPVPSELLLRGRRLVDRPSHRRESHQLKKLKKLKNGQRMTRGDCPRVLRQPFSVLQFFGALMQ